MILPIIMSAPMVRAILREIESPGTGKVMTRRLAFKDGKPTTWKKMHDRVQAGEKAWIWVREAWRIKDLGKRVRVPDGQTFLRQGRVEYRADGYEPAPYSERSPIHMYEWASRLTLEVTGTKMEELFEITDNDVVAEGVEIPDWKLIDKHDVTRTAGHDLFRPLWDSLHGSGAWDANPEVIAPTFIPHLQNISEIERAE